MSERVVTVDTGGPDDLFVGALVTWLHVPRGGYGFVQRVPVEVRHVGRRRVRVEAELRDGERVVRTVLPENLRWNVTR